MYEIPSTVRVIPQAFPALDGYPLQGTLFAPPAASPVQHAVVFNCGGGIRASRYRHFAAWLAERGVPVLTYDYRGVGASRPVDLRGLKADIEDWSEYDVGGAIAHLRLQYPRATLIGIAHSIGGFLFGGAPNGNEIGRFVFLSPHTGYVGDYRKRYRLPMYIVWHLVMPVLTRAIGYFPGKALGLGEDIPAIVALEWSGRRSPGLLDNVTGARRERVANLIRRCSQLRGELIAIRPTDDPFSTMAATFRVLALFPCAKGALLSIDASQARSSPIGHFGFFRPGADRHLWPALLGRILPNGCETQRQHV